jgi:FtsP/CotA-like multicopper oxidase with cupredoxin domain
MKANICSLIFLFLFIDNIASAEVREYNLVIKYGKVNITGRETMAMTINDSIPGPELKFREGDLARIHVRNEMKVETSIHWHGVLLPNLQDGVPYVTTPPILPGGAFTYEFPLKHSGTYWYHSHSGLQEQRGVFGSIVIEPAAPDIIADRELVVVLSDWTDESPAEVLRTLKSGSDYYSLKKGSVQSLLGAVKAKAIPDVVKRSWKRMPPMDISDIAYDRFLVNGKPEAYFNAQPKETLRLRIINAAAATYFYLQFAGGGMRLFAADGMHVQPVHKNRFLIAIAETYDVVITVPEKGAYEFRATAQDGSGFTSLFIGAGQQVAAPDIPKPNLYKMHGAGHDGMQMEGGMAAMMLHAGMAMAEEERPLPPYDDLRSVESTALSEENPTREVMLDLTGDMERYIWSINGRTLNEADSIRINHGENVRFILVNKTMMHHPMHLHGHFFRVINKHGDYSPLKHTVDVPPLGTRVIEFHANEEKDWFFHCHVLYHMMAGMARIVRYEGSDLDPMIAGIRKNMFTEHWYLWADASLLTGMTAGKIVVASTRDQFMGVWESGWKGDYEAELTYERYFNRFFQAFTGVVLSDRRQGHRGIIGGRYLLPFMFEGSIWLDTEGAVRFSLANSMRLTDRLFVFGEFRYDSATKEEWLGGAVWNLGRHFSIVGQYHSEYKWGIGFKALY